ncbi:MAG: Protein phosphatase 1 regulatory subunit sds22 [Caeruleum heppii]|nr:MAG: Protein phosphatase 1 regulatory subunit sds22 [Caeruleum heppii]
MSGQDPPSHDEARSAGAEEAPQRPATTQRWDGKLRVDRRPVITNPEALSDPEYSDEDAPPQVQIEADEDLLDDYPLDTEEIDLVHCRISSIPALRLERFTHVQRFCLRQNAIQDIDGLEPLGDKLRDLDLYDNLIAHIRGLEPLTNLTSLDLSFNKIKTIKRLEHLKALTDIYFVQNKISRIEGLAALTKLRNLELAANRIREIENLETLTGLEELWLGKNKITELKGLEDLKGLEELYISHNALDEITGLDNNLSLRVLDVSNNRIRTLSGLAHLKQLEEVWASNNEIASFEEVESQLKDKESLNTVYFEGNPLQTKNPVLYRNKVRLALPQVQQIDATFVRVS